MDRSILNSINDQAGLAGTPGSPAIALNQSLPYIFGVAGIFLLVNIITAGFKIMNSQGDPKAMQEAQLKLKNSALGVLILFTSFWIVKLVLQFFGIDVLIFDVI
jgi:hypothetical protein